MRVAYLTHPSSMLHEMGPGHPECPERVAAISDRLRARGVLDLVEAFDAPEATEAQIERAHDGLHFAELRAAAPADGYVRLDPDTAMNPHTWKAALHAAGAAVHATELVLRGGITRAFCNVRPPGHHAERARAMGFCFFNNVAVGVRYAQAKGVKRALVIDWDVHHGNGTEAIFYEDPDVYYVSMHQSPHYPGTGAPTLRGHGPGIGRNLNLPVPPGLPASHYVGELLKGLDFVLSEFTPDIIFISAGFDAAFGDPLAGLTLAPDDYALLTRRVLEIAATHCENRVISALEGGYDLDNLAECGAAHVAALAGLDAD